MRAPDTTWSANFAAGMGFALVTAVGWGMKWPVPIATEQIGALTLKGLSPPVITYNVPLLGSQAALRVIEGGAPTARPSGRYGAI